MMLPFSGCLKLFMFSRMNLFYKKTKLVLKIYCVFEGLPSIQELAECLRPWDLNSWHFGSSQPSSWEVQAPLLV